MKKVLSILLALLLAVSMTACGDSSEPELQEPGEITSDEAEYEQAQEEEAAQEQEVSVPETVLVDESGVKITAKGLEADGLFGPELKLLIENESGKNLTVQCRSVSVNGYMVEPMMSVDVVDGKKANDSITFMDSDLEACGIDQIADMEFSFCMFDTDTWEDYLNTDVIELKTSIADTYEYIYDDSGELAYEGEGVRIIVKGLAEDDSLFGPSIIVYLENNSEKAVTVQTRDVSINGFMTDAIFSCDVAAGKRAVDAITFMESDLEENEITAIEDVELSFHIYDSAEWETIVDTEVVSITF